MAGSVGVSRDKGKLRLYWSWEGRQRYLSTGLADTPLNRKVVEQLRLQIEVDIATGNYDPTLSKYDDRKAKAAQLSAYHLFERFIEYKRPNADPRTIEKYAATLEYLRELFGTQRRADGIGVGDALRLRDFLLSAQGRKMSPRTVKERIGLLRSCWRWSARQQPPVVTGNPWEEVVVLGQPRQKPQPFTKAEARAILEQFQGTHYYHFVWAWFSTGMRTGEIRGLLWQHVGVTGSPIWVGESLARGNRRKAAKRYRDREILPPPKLKRWLAENRGEPSALVFPGPKGEAIDEHNFCKRQWTTALAAAGVAYRRPYNIRHTFITELVNARWDLPRIAKVAGTSEKMILENYLGGNLEEIELPSMD